MTDDNTSSGGRPRRPPPPVIDLTATDVSPDAPPGASDADAASAAASSSATSVPEVTSSGSSGEPPHEPPREPPFGSPPEPDAHPPLWRRLVPAVAAAAIGAIVALVVAIGWYPLVAPPARDDSELATRLARVEAQQREAARAAPADRVAPDTKAIDELSARVARLESALANAQPGAADPALANRLGALEAQTKVLADGAANLNRRADETAEAAREARERADAAAKSLAEVAGQLAQFNAERARTPPVERRDVDDMSRRVAALESNVKSLESNIKSLGEQVGRAADPSADRALRNAVLALALNRAVERGAPYGRELAALDPPAPTRAALAPFAETGVPSAQTLSRELAAVIPAARAAADVKPPEGGFLERLSANAERLVRVRPVGDAQGDDPAAVLARLDAAAARADIPAALAEAGKLPPAARAPLEPWIKRAQAREAALAASAKLADVSDLAQGAPSR
jgi:hypothetical protein